jgi:hypothetical protein
MLDRNGVRLIPFLLSTPPGLPGLPAIIGAWTGDLLSSSAVVVMAAAWFWVRTAPTTAGRGGLCGSGWRMLGRRSGGGWGRGGAGGSAGSMGASGAGGTKASWYFRFGVGCWAKEGEAEAASVSGGSGGERMDWMRSWEAIVTVGWFSRRDPLTQAQADEAFPGHTVQCNRRLQDRSAVAMRARQGRAETRRPVGVGRRTASERLKYAAQERTLPVRLLAVAAAGAGSGAARQTGRRRVERAFDTEGESEREGGRDGAGRRAGCDGRLHNVVCGTRSTPTAQVSVLRG